jgi:hypothetical protein
MIKYITLFQLERFQFHPLDESQRLLYRSLCVSGNTEHLPEYPKMGRVEFRFTL